MHDIKSFAIGALLNSSLLQGQLMIFDKKNLVRDNTKSKGDRKASGGFEHKIVGFKTVTFISSRCFCGIGFFNDRISAKFVPNFP